LCFRVRVKVRFRVRARGVASQKKIFFGGGGAKANYGGKKLFCLL